MSKQSSKIRKTRTELLKRYHAALLKDAGGRSELPRRDLAARTGGANPENKIWTSCTSRSGSTGLRSVMAELGGYKVWEDPDIGRLFGDFYGKAQKGQLGSANFIRGNPTRKGWLSAPENRWLRGVTSWIYERDHGSCLASIRGGKNLLRRRRAPSWAS